ncbi:uncharacterized protein [Antedon mediterranea]|uniref:uncharacterized protein isoform X2 n=1 Tax=Antedon mediterranea TaxID=105859 RepID=UPI003AF41F9D
MSTTAPIKTAEPTTETVTTEGSTTVPITTTEAVTTEQSTTAPITTSTLTKEAVTTEVSTTTYITTVESTTETVTTKQSTTAPITTAESTTVTVTTKQSTTAPITTAESTTETVTTEQSTTAPITTAESTTEDVLLELSTVASMSDLIITITETTLSITDGNPIKEKDSTVELTLSVVVTTNSTGLTLNGFDLWALTVFINDAENENGETLFTTRLPGTTDADWTDVGLMSTVDTFVLENVDVTLDLSDIVCSSVPYVCVALEKANSSSMEFTLDSEPSGAAVSCTAVDCLKTYLLPYGEEVGDSSLRKDHSFMNTDSEHLDYVSHTFQPPNGFPLGSEFYPQIYFTENGVFFFKKVGDITYTSAHPRLDNNLKFAAPFWADGDLGDDGDVFFQEFVRTNPDDSDMIDTIANYINNSPQSITEVEFRPTWVLQATWTNLHQRPYDVSVQQTNTFQGTLATDGIYSFILFNFENRAMIWNGNTESPADALIGFNAANGYAVLVHPNGTDSTSLTKPASLSVDELYRPDQFIGNTNEYGRWIYRLELNTVTTVNPLQRCIDWYNSEPPATTWNREEHNTCPCTYKQAIVDGRFTWAPVISLLSYGQGRSSDVDFFLLSKNYDPSYLDTVLQSSETVMTCFQSASNFDNAGVNCCYLDNQLIKGYYDVLASSFAQRSLFQFGLWGILNNYYDNIIGDLFARYECCTASNDRNRCDLYYEKRPPASCDTYRPPQTSFFWGDPHLSTMDGYTYTFNGKGEYVCSALDNGQFSLLGRMSDPLNGPLKATIFSAFAAKHSTDTETVVQFTMWKNGTGFDILINGTEEIRVDDLKEGQYSSTNDPTLSIFLSMDNFTSGSDRVFVSWDSGINFGVAVSEQILDVVLQYPQIYIGRTKGLFGIWNDDTSDDVCFQNETCIDPTKRNLTERELFDVGNSWRISADESLFVYTADYNYESINNLSFVPAFTDELLNEVQKDFLLDVQEACGNSKECLYDALVTENLAVGVNTKQVNDIFRDDEYNLGLFPPNITSIIDMSKTPVLNGTMQIFAKVGEQVVLAIVANPASAQSSLLYSLRSSVAGASIDSDGIFTWTPMNTEVIMLEIVVSDGVLSSSVFLEVRLCACVNGECKYDALLDGYDIVNNMFGLVDCICTSAWSGADCSEDFDACSDDPCHPGVTCKDNLTPEVGNTCGNCPSGLIGDGFKCYDYDECASKMDNDNQPFCDHEELCTNTLGSYTCACRSGFSLHPNGKFCLDVDECDLDIDNCDVNAQCNNTMGSFVCTCDNGYSGDGSQCIDVDECSQSLCSEYTDCMNTIGSFVCTCQEGFRMDESICKDIDECGLQTSNCQQTCENDIGSYNCSCYDGFEIEADQTTCNAVSSCVADSCTNADCFFDEQPHCVCFSGFAMEIEDNTTCIDVNECSNISLNFCDMDNGICHNTIGGYNCSCTDGFTLDNDLRTCTDIDECLVNSCQANSECTNTRGSYTCTCLSGFRSSEQLCIDVNECEGDSNNCDENASCVNTYGSFVCTCNTGYVSIDDGNGRTGTCQDYDECLYNLDNCATTASCNNTIGSFVCTCNHGYTGDGVTCQDINECEQDPCAENENRQCVNQQGSYTCPCDYDSFQEQGTCIAVETVMLRVVFTDLLGWKVDTFFHLFDFEQDSDEIQNQMNAHFNKSELSNSFLEVVATSFSNTTGGIETSFAVKFREGSDISEEKLLKVFLDNLTGRNKDFVEPYNRVDVADTASQLPVDPCETETDNCSERFFVNCVYIENSTYTCNTCVDGYQLVHDSCVDIDECETGTHDCTGVKELCSNTGGGYACQCESGYSYNSNQVCEDINECNNNSLCTTGNEVCINLPGNYACDCDSGYTRIEQVCQDVNECLYSSTICSNENEVCTNTPGSYLCECEPTFIRSNGECLTSRRFRGQIRVIEVNRSAELAEWDNDLLDNTSDKYQTYATHICIIVDDIYAESLQTTATFYTCSIIGFSEGSIISVYEIQFYANSTETANNLVELLLNETDFEDRLHSIDNMRSVRIDPTQVTIQEFPIVCEDDYCKNGGTCQINNLFDQSCSCVDGYSGDNCDLKANSSDSLLWILLVVLGLVFIIVLLACFCCLFFIIKRQRRDTLPARKSWPNFQYPAVWNPARNQSMSDSSISTYPRASDSSQMAHVARAIDAMSHRQNHVFDLQDDALSSNTSDFIRPYVATGMESAEQQTLQDQHVPFSYLHNPRQSAFVGFANRGFRTNHRYDDSDSDDHYNYLN